MYKKLQQDYAFLQEDYTNQQTIANDIRLEATNLLAEIKSISLRNDELSEENKRLKESSGSSGAAYDNSTGVIDQGSITAYQHAVDELLVAARSDTPKSVLVAMKSIVITCKNITEDTENFEVSLASVVS